MRYYDLSYLISPDLSEKEAQQFNEKIIDFILKEGGILDTTQSLKKINLAYPIKKKKEAYFATLTFFLSPQKAPLLSQELEKEEKILRFLIFKKKSPQKIKKAQVSKPKPPLKEKVKLEELEKKLEEILKE